MSFFGNPKVYVRHNEDGFYVGQSVDIETRRGTSEHGRKIATFPASHDHHLRKIQETELIQFYDAAGVPLTNKQQRTQPCVGIELEEEWR